MNGHTGRSNWGGKVDGWTEQSGPAEAGMWTDGRTDVRNSKGGWTDGRAQLELASGWTDEKQTSPSVAEHVDRRRDEHLIDHYHLYIRRL